MRCSYIIVIISESSVSWLELNMDPHMFIEYPCYPALSTRPRRRRRSPPLLFVLLRYSGASLTSSSSSSTSPTKTQLLTLNTTSPPVIALRKTPTPALIPSCSRTPSVPVHQRPRNRNPGSHGCPFPTTNPCHRQLHINPHHRIHCRRRTEQSHLP